MWYYVPSACVAASEDSSLDSDPWHGREPSVTLSGTPTQRPCSWRGWTMRPWIWLLSGLTCLRLTLEDGVGVWTSLLRGSHASPGPWLGSEKKYRTRAGFGTISTGSFAQFNRVSCSWRTCQVSLLEGFPEFSGTWPQAGMMLRGIVSRLSKSGRRTSANVCSYSRGLYPTPSATPYGTSQNEGEVEHDRPSRGTPSLESWARGRQWPTPTVRGNWNKEGYSSKSGQGLQQVAADVSHPDQTKSKDGMVLNPQFVETLMGFPPGWTDCDASVTPSSQNRRL